MPETIDALLAPLSAAPREAAGRPVIAVTTYCQGEDHYIRRAYTEQIVRAGGLPVLVVLDSDAQAAAEIVERCDALLLAGGGDINPLWTGEAPHPEVGGINTARDRFELTLALLAYRRGIPVLGICRGIQTLATALGGHVCQHITTAFRHRQDAPKSDATHTVAVTPGTVLDKVTGGVGILAYDDKERRQECLRPQSRTLAVNSFHHQCVDKTGPRFRVAATAPDGTIEAMESTDFRPILGVQWHPEQLGCDGLPLFRWLVDEGTIRQRVKQLHQAIVSLDSHCDTPMLFSRGIDFLTRCPEALCDLHKMDDGLLDATTLACYLPQPKLGERFSDKVQWPTTSDGASTVEQGRQRQERTTPPPCDGRSSSSSPQSPPTPFRYANAVFDAIEALCRRAPERIAIARTPADIARDKRQHRHSLLLAIENGLALEGDVKNVRHFRQRGATYITLCHNGDNDLCDSARGCTTHGGLSPLGRDVILEMNRQGLMVDLSHASEQSFWQALDISETPIVCSHSSCRALCDHPRNLTDQQLRALADHGGVCQLTLYPGFLSTDGHATLSTLIAHIEHARDVAGIEHIGLGTDFDGDGGIPGLESAASLTLLTRQLLLRHWSERDISRLYGQNWLRVMAAVQKR